MEFQKIIDEEWISVNMRVGRQENYIPNTEQDENRPTVGNILLTIDLFNIYDIYTWIWTAPWLAGTRPEQRLWVTAVWKGKRAPCRSNCKLSLDWHKGGLGTYIFNRSGNRHKSGEVGCLQYECTEYCIWICHSSLYRGAPKRVKACQFAWWNHQVWSGAIQWSTTSSLSCAASLSPRSHATPTSNDIHLLHFCSWSIVPFNIQRRNIHT